MRVQIDPHTISITDHARERMIQRHVSEQDLRDCLFDAYLQRRPDGSQRLAASGSDVNLVLDPSGTIIITAYRRHTPPWQRPRPPRGNRALMQKPTLRCRSDRDRALMTEANHG